VSEQGLKAVTPLGGYAESIGTVSVAEVSGQGIVAIAPPQGEAYALSGTLQTAYGLDWALVGLSTSGTDARLLGVAPDQGFLLFPHDGPDAVPAVAAKLGQAAWLTDQSDSWAILRVSGTGSREALARICMLDLHPDIFGPGAVSRTTMEHLGVIILLEESDTFLLMSPTSSAESFLDAVVTSAKNIVPPNSAAPGGTE